MTRIDIEIVVLSRVTIGYSISWHSCDMFGDSSTAVIAGIAAVPG